MADSNSATAALARLEAAIERIAERLDRPGQATPPSRAVPPEVTERLDGLISQLRGLLPDSGR